MAWPGVRGDYLGVQVRGGREAGDMILKSNTLKRSESGKTYETLRKVTSLDQQHAKECRCHSLRSPQRPAPTVPSSRSPFSCLLKPRP